MLPWIAAVFLAVASPSAAGADILQEKLNDLIARIEKAASDVVATGGQQGSLVIAAAGREMTESVNRFRSVYNDMLGETMDALDQITSKKLHELETAVEKFETRVAATMEDATKDAQQLANSLPIANHIPQLRRYLPRFAAPKQAAPPFVMRIDGNFVHAAREGLRPFIVFGKKRYEAAGVTTQQLTFDLPNGDLAPYVDPRTLCFVCPSPPPSPPLRFASLDLVVPFEERRFLFFNRRRELTFRLLVGVLRGGPGTFTFVTPVFAHERQTLRSETVRQASGGLRDFDEVYECSEVPAGWTLVPNSGRLVVDAGGNGEGTLWWRRPFSNAPVKYRVFTKHNEKAESGDVTFHIECDIERSPAVAAETERLFFMRWGESRLFRRSEGWRIQLDSFRGETYQLTGAADLPGLVSTREVGDGWIEVRSASLNDM